IAGGIVSRRQYINRCFSASIKTEILTVPEILSNHGDTFNLQLTPGNPICRPSMRRKYTLSTHLQLSDSDFLRDGYFRSELEFYHPSEYCVHGISRNDITVIVCDKTCTETTPCISSCCPLGQGLSGGGSCQPIQANLTTNAFTYAVVFVNNDGTTLKKQEILSKHFHYTQAKGFGKNCRASNGTFPTPEMFTPQEPHQLMEGFQFHLNGDLSAQDVVYSRGAWVRLGPENYCLDKWTDTTSSAPRTTVFVCLHNTSQVSPEYEPSINENKFRQRQLALGVAAVVASLFPLLTFLVYVFILRQRNIHGLTVISMSLTLFFMYIFLCISNFINAFEDRNSLKTFRCKAIGFLGNYFFLSLFCWLTVTCFDLWWTFRRMKPSVTTKRTKFCGYAAFGWGMPFLFVCTGALLDTYYSCTKTPQTSCSLTPPKYGHQNCFLSVEALGIYLYYPAAILLILNLVFFVLTVVKLQEYNKSTKFATENVTKKRKTLLLCLKLFLVMGIFWIFEVISWKFDDYGWGWFVVDIIKNLQAVGLFVIFVCKEHTWAETRKCVKSLRKTPTVSTDITLNSK
ncbi:unnamed protein product, partial [Allacma fusca]